MLNRLWFTFVLMLIFQQSIAQQNAMVYGMVRDSTGNPLQDVNIQVLSTEKGTSTDQKGYYELKIPAGQEQTLRFSYLNIIQKEYSIPPQNPSSTYRLDVTLQVEMRLSPIQITEMQGTDKTNLKKISPKDISLNPTAGSRVEGLLKTLPGVSSTNELSSSYSVRGGNYDENLIYINDIEVYRPFLARAGQQEGLSIINSDLVKSIKFSAGGFEARYGDKMSSVLDIRYKEPGKFGGSVSGNLLGGTAHLEGSSSNGKFTYLMGARYRTNQYLLNSLDVEGDYKPTFVDFQSYLTYNLSPKWELGLLTYYGKNKFLFIPENRETAFGTPNQVMRLNIYFDGKELMEYETLLNALSATYTPKTGTELKFIASGYGTQEKEYFDIVGEYWLDELDTDPASEDFQEAKANLGIGSFINHARNRLFANIFNFAHKGKTYLSDNAEFKWGVKYRHESINDRLREWRMLDSADFSIPHNNDDKLKLERFANSRINLSNNRLIGYVQNTFNLSPAHNAYLTLGLRGHYWDYNDEFLTSPRIQFVMEPNRRYNRIQMLRNPDSPGLRKNIRLKAATGIYYQPPFYREFRDREGALNPDIKSQKSYHFVLGSEIMLKILGKPFKWSSELYFKYIENLIPYDIDDVRIRYFARNNAIGYAAGLDMQFTGELIQGLPSWVSFSLMSTKEKIDGDEYTSIDRESGDTSIVDPGFVRRPTDQLFQFNLYFQDFLPNHPSYKVFLNMLYSTNLPFGPPESKQFRNQLKMGPFQRVDVGFSRLLGGKKAENNLFPFLRHFKAVWASVEIFNLFGFENPISHFWLTDVNNNQRPVPNYLTGRRFNIDLRIEF